MNDFIEFIIGIGLIYLFFKFGRNTSHSESHTQNQNRRTTKMYYVKGIRHTSGTLHVLYSDAMEEKREWDEKYPGEGFVVKEKEIDDD